MISKFLMAMTIKGAVLWDLAYSLTLKMKVMPNCKMAVSL
jgi:hypothetical protein